MKLGGLQKLTLIDFPNKIAATVFTVGCNFNCAFCHNSELADLEKIKSHPVLEEDDFFSFLEKRKNRLDGVCISGGEPTIQKDLIPFIGKIKDLGFAVKLDTNGGRPDVLEKLIAEKMVDYFAMDIKAPLEKYSQVTDVKQENIIKSADLIKNSGIDYEFRTTAAPWLVEKNDFEKIAKWLKGSKRYFIQQFIPATKILDKRYLDAKPYSKEELEEIRDAIKGYFGKCNVRC